MTIPSSLDARVPRSRTWIALLGATILGLTGACFAQAQGVPRSRVEDRLPRYGGYLPAGWYPADSGAPLGGYTPFGVDGPEAGWLNVDYGLGYDDFANSYDFGSNRLTPAYRNNSGFERRPREYGRGIWNGYGRADVNPPTVWRRQASQ